MGNGVEITSGQLVGYGTVGPTIGNVVAGNFIGTNATGTVAFANLLAGISVSAASNIIGGSASVTGNLISGNAGDGIRLTGSGTIDNVVQGNLIGTTATGNAPLGNAGIGINILAGAAFNVIGVRATVNLSSTFNVVGLANDGVPFAGGLDGAAAYSANLLGGSIIFSGSAYRLGTPGVNSAIAAAGQTISLPATSASTLSFLGTGVYGSQLNQVFRVNYTDGSFQNFTQSLSDWYVPQSFAGESIVGTYAYRDAFDGSRQDFSASNQFPSLYAYSFSLDPSKIVQSITLPNNSDVDLLAMNLTPVQSVAAAQGNVVSGNAGGGIAISNATTSDNVVAGNTIGLTASGSAALANTGAGIVINGSSRNLIGGASVGARNVISGNTGDGVQISGSTATSNFVQGNFIGTNAAGTAAVPNDTSAAIGGGVDISGASGNTIGGLTSTPGTGLGNVISGNADAAIFTQGAIGGTLIQGNLIGTDSTGTHAIGNGFIGAFGTVRIASPNNTVGGTAAGARNVVSGGGRAGIQISAQNTVVQGNFIGTDITGLLALGNQTNGIAIGGNIPAGPENILIGGTSAAARNVISGNLGDGINITGATDSGNVVQGNFIGTNALGTAALGNHGSGISIASPSNTIGGLAAGARNVISGNATNGITLVAGANANVIQANFIGTNAAGSGAVANTGFGIFVNGGTNNTIGGTAGGAGNVIANNGNSGVDMTGAVTTGNFVQNNTYQSNTNFAVELDSSAQAYISGTVAGNVLDNGTIDLNGLNASIGALSGAGSVTNSAAGTATLTVGVTNAGARFDGVIRNAGGAVALTKVGTGTEVLTGLNTYSGVTIISAGVLQIGSANATGSLGSGGVVDNSTLTFNLANNTSVANSISGSGGLTQAGVGTLTLAGVNTYSGTTTINVGATLQAGSPGALSANSTFGDAGILNLGGFSNSVGALNGNGTVTNSITSTYQIDDGALANSSGTIFGFNNSLLGEAEDTWVGNVFTATAGATRIASVSFAAFTALNATTLPSPFVTAALYTGSPSTGLTLVPGSVNTVPLNAAAFQMVTVPFAVPQNLSAGQVFTAALLINNVPVGVFPFIETAIGTNTNSYYDVSSPFGSVNSYNLASPNAPTLNGLNFPGVNGTNAGVSITLLRANAIPASATTAATLTVTAGGTFSGAIQDGTGTVALTKTGNNTLSLRGANTNSGNTTLTAGTLLVTGALGSGSVSIAGGATLNDQVIVTQDSGLGSLRQAITNSNHASGAGLNLISFNIAGPGLHVISPVSVLPAITSAVLVDGATQPGQGSTPRIAISGTSAGVGATGLTLAGANIQVVGLNINQFSGDGIDVTGSNNSIEKSFIGTDPTGQSAAPNGGAGIRILGSNNTIGDVSQNNGNVIAFNALAGVAVSGAAAVGNSIRGNSIFGNGGLGIDLTGTGNHQQSAPVVIAAALDPNASTTQIKATFTGAPNTTYILDYYDNQTTTDPSGFGQGRIYLGTTTITTDASGNPSANSANFLATLDAELPEGDVLAVTATDAAGNTSQFSNDVTGILRPTIDVTGLGLAVRGQRLTYSIAPDVSATDLAAGLIYTVDFGDNTTPQAFTSSSSNVVTSGHEFIQAQPMAYTITVTVQDQFGFGSVQTTQTLIQVFALENNDTELHVGGQFGGSTFQLTGILDPTQPATDTFNLKLDGGSTNPPIGLTINHLDSEFTPAVLAGLTKFVLWGQDATGSGSNIFDASTYVGTVDIHNGRGNNTLVGSATGVNHFNYDAHSTDNLLIIAPSTATNILDFSGADQGVHFDLGQLSGQLQQVTATGDMLAISGSVPIPDETTQAATVNTYFTSNFNDTLSIPNAFGAGYSTPFSVTSGTGNDTFTIGAGGVANDTFTIQNSVFTNGGGNDTFTIGGLGATTGNDTFTINNSTFAASGGNDTFTIGGTTVGAGLDTFTVGGATTFAGNDTFTIHNVASTSFQSGSSFTGNDTFTIASSGLGHDTFTIGASATFTGNDTFTIGSTGAFAGNDTFTITNAGTFAGNDTFTIGSNSIGHDTFTINNSFTGSAGNDTFTINTLSAGNDTFTIGNSITSSLGNDTFTIGSFGVGNDTFTIGGLGATGTGNASFIVGNFGTGSDTFTIGGFSAALSAGNDTFTIGSFGTGNNDTFTITGAITAGTGNDTFTITNSGTGTDHFALGDINAGNSVNDTFTIGAGALAAGNDTFTIGNISAGTGSHAFTIGSSGVGNDTFTIGAINAAGSLGNDTFTIGSSGTGNDTFVINGAVSTGVGNDAFLITSAGGGSDTFTIKGGIQAGAGNDTFTISNSGAAVGNDTFTINSSFAGTGNDTFVIQNLGAGASNDTFVINGTFTAGAGNDTFTINNQSGGNDTFTINGGIDASASTGLDTFTIAGSAIGNDTFTIGAIQAGTGSNSFTIGSSGVGNDTFTIGAINAAGSLGNDTFTIGSTGTGNDTFVINGAVTTGVGNDTFLITTSGGASDTFTITGGIQAGAGSDTFTINNAGAAVGNDTFTINSSFAGTGNDTFVIQNLGAGASNDTFVINGAFTAGSGNDTFIINNLSGGNDTFTINGTIDASASTGHDTFTIAGSAIGNDTFTIGNIQAGTGSSAFTIGSSGVGNDTFTIGAINAAGNLGNDTFTIGSSGTGSDTFTIASITGGVGNDTFVITTSGGGNDTFTIAGGVTAVGAGNDTFVINNSGASTGSDTFTINSNFTGGTGVNQFFIQDTSSSHSNDTFTINGNFTGGVASSDTFVITSAGAGLDTFTITGNFTGGTGGQNAFLLSATGTGNDTFTIHGSLIGGGTTNDVFEMVNSGSGNNHYTITSGIHDAGTGSDIFLLSNTGAGDNSFNIQGGITFGTGDDLFSINTVGDGDNSILLSGPVVLGNADNTFFTISQAGDGNNTIEIDGSVTAGNGTGFMTLGTAGAGTDVITVTGPIAFGAGTDSFQINGGGAGHATFNLLGGVKGQGYDTYTIEDPGAIASAESMTVNGNLGGGAGSNTFIVTSGLNYHAAASTFTLNGNLIGGAGFNTFSITDSGLAQNSFTLNGTLQGGSNDQGDVFQLAGLYGTVHMSSGTGAGGDTYEFSGGVQGSFVIQAPNNASRIDTLDFSTLNTGATVHLAQTSTQQVAPGLTLQLSDSAGFSNVIGSAFDDTIYGNARTNLLQGSVALASTVAPNTAVAVSPGKMQVVLLDFDTAFNQANGVFNFNSFYAQKGVTPLHNYSQSERQAIQTEQQGDYAPFVQAGAI